MGRYRIIRGVEAASGGVLPSISMDATDAILASVAPPNGAPVLRHDINPAYLSAVSPYTLYGLDRCSGKEITAQRSTVEKIASEALFNGFPAINCLAADADGGSDLTLKDYLRSGFFTFVAVVTIDAVLKAAPRAARLVSIVAQPNSTLISFGMTSSGNISIIGFGANAAIPAGSVPAANTPFIVWGQYSASANKFQVGINSSEVVDDAEPTSTVEFNVTDQMGIGSPTTATTSNLAWHGKIARLLTFKSSLGASYLDTVINTLNSKYIA